MSWLFYLMLKLLQGHEHFLHGNAWSLGIQFQSFVPMVPHVKGPRPVLQHQLGLQTRFPKRIFLFAILHLKDTLNQCFQQELKQMLSQWHRDLMLLLGLLPIGALVEKRCNHALLHCREEEHIIAVLRLQCHQISLVSQK